MTNKSSYFIALFSLLFSLFFVKSIFAKDISSTVWFSNSSFTPLYLDTGFLGHQFNLDLSNLHLKVNFQKDDLQRPGVLTILTDNAKKTDSILDRQKYRLLWTSNYAEKPDIINVTLIDPDCGQGNHQHCVIKEEYQGQTIIHESSQKSGQASANIHLNSRFYLSEVKGWMTHGDASWYAYKNCFCAASPDFPKGTYIKVVNQNDEQKTIIVKINDYGPERDIFPNRVIDLDKIAFQELSSLSRGVIQVRVQPATDQEVETFFATHLFNCQEAPKTTKPKTSASIDDSRDKEVVAKITESESTNNDIDWEY